jgi:2-C-methyl-D-erythritol 4-phosphate cytidylyltransferase
MVVKPESNGVRVKTVAVIPSAGLGLRMGSDQAKQFMVFNGKPLLAATLQPFQRCEAVDAVVLMVPPNDIAFCRKDIVERFKLDKVKTLIAGGKRRQDSVRLGLEAIAGNFKLVLIHDGVRPIITESLIQRVIDAARIHRAVITGLPAKETVKEVDSDRQVIRTYDRKQVWLIQTPQAFRYEDIFAAHQKAHQEDWDEATDDSVLLERMGIPITVIEGDENNIKITTPNDMELAKLYLERL